MQLVCTSAAPSNKMSPKAFTPHASQPLQASCASDSDCAAPCMRCNQQTQFCEAAQTTATCTTSYGNLGSCSAGTCKVRCYKELRAPSCGMGCSFCCC